MIARKQRLAATSEVCGKPVVTFDGKRLGAVEEHAVDHVRVHRRFGRDYWLSRALIRDSSEDVIVLHISRDSVDKYKLRELHEGGQERTLAAEGR